MFALRKASDRGHAQHGWLDTWHTFSFGDYYDPAQMGFRALRVMNEDFIAPGQGFGMHGHRDMEIITCVLEGELAHRDSLGTVAVLKAGQFQRMTAGSGIRHSEFNPSAAETAHLYQIWILPEQSGLTPSYEDREFPSAGMQNQLERIASRYGRGNSMKINQDVSLYRASLAADVQSMHPLETGRHAWLQVVRGQVQLGDLPLTAGDGVAVSDESAIAIRAQSPAEVLLFDLA
ncbi:MAG TPA: pirin family protein [Pirellulaceae bacterium]|nr:pirin family protein [Pirellulaceae bacterium]